MNKVNKYIYSKLWRLTMKTLVVLSSSLKGGRREGSLKFACFSPSL